MPEYDWRFEPCDPEGERDGFGLLWPHAAKGVKPTPAGGRLVETGYGHTERGAMDDVRRRCAERDQRASGDDDAQLQHRNPFVSTWGPAKGSRWHEGM